MTGIAQGMLRTAILLRLVRLHPRITSLVLVSLVSGIALTAWATYYTASQLQAVNVLPPTPQTLATVGGGAIHMAEQPSCTISNGFCGIGTFDLSMSPAPPRSGNFTNIEFAWPQPGEHTRKIDAYLIARMKGGVLFGYKTGLDMCLARTNGEGKQSTMVPLGGEDVPYCGIGASDSRSVWVHVEFNADVADEYVLQATVVPDPSIGVVGNPQNAGQEILSLMGIGQQIQKAATSK